MSKVVAHPEPVATEIDFANKSYTIKLVSALNWYNTEKDKKDARKYIEDYAKRTGVRLGDYTDSDIVLTMGWLARLANKGAILSADHVHHLNRYMARLSALKKVQVQASVQRVSIQEATQNRISSYLGELEGVFDEIAKNPKQEFSLLADLKKNQLPQAAASDVGDWTKSKVRELVAAYEGKDKDLAEGYSNFNKRDLMAVIKRLASFLEDAEKYSAFKKANRKPREKKVKPPTQQVKTLKYKPRDEDLQITSIPPTNIVGAQQVWLFNTKTRKLSVYRTDSALGIQVKGTTLQNYDPDMSCQKTLRKPAEQVKELMAAGKVQLRKFMDSIKAVEMPCNGRLNEDTLILRAMK
jgi:hypothetical protein